MRLPRLSYGIATGQGCARQSGEDRGDGSARPRERCAVRFSGDSRLTIQRARGLFYTPFSTLLVEIGAISGELRIEDNYASYYYHDYLAISDQLAKYEKNRQLDF